MKRTGQRGLTHLEILLIVTLVATIAAVVVVMLLPPADKSPIIAAEAHMKDFELALAQYKLTAGTFPTTVQGLQELRPYLKKEIPNDPWGRPYFYKFPGDHGDAPDIYSYGPDGQPSADDIQSWK